eukprot:1161047-Pelagomonas_calceolata.AAC.51
MSIFRQRGELQYTKFDYLLRGPKVMGVDNPIADWVHDNVWGSVQVRCVARLCVHSDEDGESTAPRSWAWTTLSLTECTTTCGAACS